MLIIASCHFKSLRALCIGCLHLKQTSIICTGLLFVPPPETDLAGMAGKMLLLTSAFNPFLKYQTGLQWGMLDSLNNNK